jgi:hypothetical protein
MLKWNAFLIVSFLVAAPGISAQHPVVLTPVQGASPSESGLTLSVTGFVWPGAPGALPLPAELMERISREGHLTALETVPAAGRTAVYMRFRFADVAAFNRWYLAEQTVGLLRDFRELTAAGTYESYVSFRPEQTSGNEAALIGALSVAVDKLLAGACTPPAETLP